MLYQFLPTSHACMSAGNAGFFWVSMPRLCVSIDDSQAFKSYEEFKTFLKVEGSSEVQQFASDVWQTGHHSCASIAHSSAELLAQHGPAIRQLLDFCRLRSGTHQSCLSHTDRVC